nr:hypothetical protein [Nocardia tengchongensis]
MARPTAVQAFGLAAVTQSAIVVEFYCDPEDIASGPGSDLA